MDLFYVQFFSVSTCRESRSCHHNQDTQQFYCCPQSLSCYPVPFPTHNPWQPLICSPSGTNIHVEALRPAPFPRLLCVSTGPFHRPGDTPAETAFSVFIPNSCPSLTNRQTRQGLALGVAFPGEAGSPHVLSGTLSINAP